MTPACGRHRSAVLPQAAASTEPASHAPPSGDAWLFLHRPVSSPPLREPEQSAPGPEPVQPPRKALPPTPRKALPPKGPRRQKPPPMARSPRSRWPPVAWIPRLVSVRPMVPRPPPVQPTAPETSRPAQAYSGNSTSRPRTSLRARALPSTSPCWRHRASAVRTPSAGCCRSCPSPPSPSTAHSRQPPWPSRAARSESCQSRPRPWPRCSWVASSLIGCRRRLRRRLTGRGTLRGRLLQRIQVTLQFAHTRLGVGGECRRRNVVECGLSRANLFGRATLLRVRVGRLLCGWSWRRCRRWSLRPTSCGHADQCGGGKRCCPSCC